MNRERNLPEMTAMRATVLLLVASLCFGLAPWFARNLVESGMAPASVAFYRFLTTFVVLLPFLSLSREKRAATLWAVSSGAAIGIGWITYVNALSGASVATVGVIYMTYPLFTLLMAWGWIGQPVSLRSLGSGALVLVGAITAVAPTLSGRGELNVLLLAFFAPIAFAFAICVLTTKLLKLKALERAAGVSLGAVFGLVPFVLVSDVVTVLPQDREDWLMILGIGVVTALIPNTLFALAGPRVGSARTAAASSFELPIMFLVGLIAFGEIIETNEIAAAMLVIVAILISPVITRKGE